MIRQDFRFALRTLARSPAYTLVALVTLALGIGANSAVFSIVNTVLLGPLPYPEADRLVQVAELDSKNGRMQAAWRNFVDWRARSTQFEGLVAHVSGESTVLGTGDALRSGTAAVSEGFFRTIGVQPVLGRALRPEEHRLGAPPAAVVSDGFWRTYLGSRRDLTATRLNIWGFDLQVVGVMPPGFEYPNDVDVWYPVELDEQSDSRTSHNYVVLGRLGPGVSLTQAKAELDGITRGFLEADPGAAQERGFADFFPRAVSVMPLQEALVGNLRRPLWILLGASLLVLLVACTNLASTTLARGTAREREYAIRCALGASRLRMTRTIVTETFALTLLGAFAGLALAYMVLQALPVLAPAGVPRIDEVRLDGAAVGFTLLLSVVAAALAGILPGWRVSNGALESLRGGVRAGDGPRGQRIWKWLIAAETALALLLLIGSGLLLKSFWSVLAVQPGFQTSGVLTATLNPPSSKFDGNERKRLYYDALLERLQSVPGVATVGLVTAAPMTWVPNGMTDIEGGPQTGINAQYFLASPGYFTALDIPLLRGRWFDATALENTEHVVVINRTFAEQAWPGQDPIGKRITGGGMDDYWDQLKWATVVGVVGDIRQRDLTLPPRPALYFSYRQRPFRASSMTAVIRPASSSTASMVPALRAAIVEVDRDVPVKFSTIEERLATGLAARRFVMLVIAAFAGLALVLASVGVYGVVAYAVERRRREIGVRLALGGQPGRVRRQVQNDYMIAIGLGAAAGVLLALGFTRLLTTMLFEVRPTDPLTFVAVLGLLAAAGWTASLVPTLRTTRVDPVETMRE